jgi:transglutaminase-like putative cysteine protease
VRLEIAYGTRYQYEPAVAAGLTALRLRPRSQRGLRVIESSLVASPGAVSSGYVDGWGTLVDVVECHESHAELSCEMRAIVETQAVEEPELLLAHEAAIYRHDSARVRRQTVAALAATCGFDGKQWPFVEAANEWVNWRFMYRLGETDAATEIETVVETGLGVCQDFAHVLIAMLRGWGWPARYVCGYQFAGEVSWGRIEDQAMHAWVEAYGPGVGWVALDPTTGKLADDRYVPIGRGRDYDDVRPVRGVLRGTKPLQRHESRLQMVIAEQ